MTALFVTFNRAGFGGPSSTVIDGPGPVTSMADVEEIADRVHEKVHGGRVTVLSWRRFEALAEQTGSPR